jgi:NAD(P)-dependent dehydrogenase (short-subunit alcohol dehydrogenase family)
MKLQGRVAIVTGASSGIGRGIAVELAREGAQVMVADLREDAKVGKYHETEPQPTTVDEIRAAGGTALFEHTDVADEQQLERLISRTLDEFGQLDVIVNNAGISIVADSQTLSLAEYDRIIAVNLRALFVATKYATPHLRRSPYGRIIHIASVHAYGGGAGAAYAASKAAAVNLTRDTALELGPYGATCNAICPGYVETAIQDYLTPAQIEQARQRTALPRFGLPRDIGRAAVFLASDDAEWVTGASLVVDGGFIAGV